MDETAFKTTAAGTVDRLSVEADAVLVGVYRRHRRHQRRRLVGVGAGAFAMIGLAVAAVTTVSPLHTDQEAALSAYTVSVTEQAPTAAVVDGVELTYLPAGLPAEPSIETSAYLDTQGQPIEGGTTTLGCFSDAGCDGMGMSITRAPGLDLAGYLETNWVGDSTETTVDGHPAVATGIRSDEASGLVWSPREGIVIELHVNTSWAPELRRVVDGIRIP